MGEKPRTLAEIKNTLDAQHLYYPLTTLSGVLARIHRQGKVRRWKSDAGFVYVETRTEDSNDWVDSEIT